MSLWNAEESQQLLAKRLLRASLIWLVIGAISGAIVTFQRVFPSLFENCSWWNLTRVQLYHTSLLLFGFGFPLVLGIWFLRLLQQRKEPMRWLPLWELGYFLWQFALCWGLMHVFIGEHSILPAWIFPPVIYGVMFVSSVMLCVATLINIPKGLDSLASLSYRFLLVGLFSLVLVLLGFVSMTQLRQYTAPSFLQALLIVALLFPLIGLILPVSLSRPKAPDHGRLSFFFWAGLFFLPLSSSAFSAAIPGHTLLFVFQVVATLAMIALLYTLLSWWRFPNLYRTHWLYQVATYAKGTAIPIGSKQTSSSDASSEPEQWIRCFQWGGICFAIAIFEATLFSLLRAVGAIPSPTWSSNHITLLLLGTGVLWLQGIFCLLAPEAQKEQRNLSTLRRFVFLGVLLISLGSWWEGLLHFYLEQTGLPRGSVFSMSGRWLRFFGHAFLWISLWWFARNLLWLVRNIQSILASIQRFDPESTDR